MLFRSAFVGGESFVLFGGSATPTYAGSFTLLPVTPGLGLSWDSTAIATTGTLGVTAGGGNAAGYIVSATVSGANLILALSAGSANTAFTVSATNNLAAPRATWPAVGGGTYDGAGNASFTNALGAGSLFYSIRVP